MTHWENACVAVIGDIVGSRAHPDREALHRRLAAVLGEVVVPAVRTAPRITVGDEFQVSLAALPAALGVVWDLRVALLPDVDVRFGLGLGEAAVLDADVEDGSAWWAARKAIEAVKKAQQQKAGAYRRVEVQAWEDRDTEPARLAGGGQAAVDALFARLDERDLVILRALRQGLGQAEAGSRAGIGQQSVSERIHRHGLTALLAAREAWAG